LGHAYAGQQFRCIEWLCYIVISSSVEGSDLFIRVIADRENQHRDVRPLSQTSQNLYAFHVGQTKVEQNHIGPTLNDFGEPGLSRLCFFDLVTCFF
jgi:hypothetical protein